MGFPTRTSRTAFGPPKENRNGVIGDPRFFENADETNLQEWQISGAGQTVDLAWAVIQTGATTGACTVLRHGYAWDPDQEAAAPTIERDGAGLFSVTFPSSGLDEGGNAVPIAFRDAKAFAQSTARRAGQQVTANNRIQISVRDEATSALSDTPTAVLVCGM